LATYGRLPSEFDQETAMGLMVNIEAVEARQALTMASAIGIALGSAEVAERAVLLATGSKDLAWSIRMKCEHERALR